MKKLHKEKANSKFPLTCIKIPPLDKALLWPRHVTLPGKWSRGSSAFGDPDPWWPWGQISLGIPQCWSGTLVQTADFLLQENYKMYLTDSNSIFFFWNFKREEKCCGIIVCHFIKCCTLMQCQEQNLIFNLSLITEFLCNYSRLFIQNMKIRVL